MFEKMKESWTKNKSISILVLLVFVALLFFITFTLGQQILSMSKDPVAFKAWIESYGIFGRLILIGFMFLQVLVAFIPGEVIEIAAGYAYGPIEGTLLCLMGASLGSLVILWLVKKYGVKMLHNFVSIDKIEKMTFLKNEKKLNTLIFTVFFIPGTPKDLLTYFVGLTRMRISTFIFITFFARIPSVITSTYGGNAVMEGNYMVAFITLIVTTLLSVLGLFVYNQWLIHKKRKSMKKETKLLLNEIE